VDRVRGIGPRWAEELTARGVTTVADLLAHLPFRYEDRRRPQPLAEARVGEPLTAIGLVRSVSTVRARHRRMEVMTVLLDDGTAALPILFFNRGYLAEWIREGSRLLVHGVPRRGRTPLELHGPEFEVLREGEDPADQTGWVPVYEKLGPLTPRRLRAVISEALAGLASLPEIVPESVARSRGLPAVSDALEAVHRPDPDTPGDQLASRRTLAHRRLAFDEFFLLETGLAVRRARTRAERRTGGYRIDDELRRRLADLLPFALTGAQRRVLREIGDDLRAPWPMNRLLLGDVGSGKTVVAALAMLVAMENGFQAALMAPTEILAQQHARSLQALLAPAGLRVDLLTAGLSAMRQNEARSRIASGSAKAVIGTHSLISEKVRFERLGLVVVDEQQRFGVVQRADLVGKGEHPDVLVMSATPIPRTLAMVIYGDLDVSILDEKPPGRQPIRTVLREASQRERVFEGVARALEEERQIYVVRPAVEEGDSGLRAAEQGLEEYRTRFPGASVALVHGRMKAAERQDAVQAFAEGRVRILVATTVIEVGIDVPAASVIVVEDADRFGLAQLHQLRGRVGRGDLRSYCVLVASEDAAEDALSRLSILEETDDGFRVSERDLELRGPGELAGTAQSGYPSFRVADLVRHQDMLLAAREDAFAFVERGGEEGLPERLWSEVQRRHGERLRLADVG
jgi:ATP-dependent DNA helicase RecG